MFIMNLNLDERSRFFGKEKKREGGTDLNGLTRIRENKSKAESIAVGEREIKSILNSGFIVKNDENFLCNTYGFIDNGIKDNYNNIFLKDNFVEVQGISFQSMTVYGRNSTIKNIVMSKDKFMEINRKRQADDFKENHGINNEFKLSDLTLKNYFSLKQSNINIDPDDISPGTIVIKHSDHYKKVEYSLFEMPSIYNFGNEQQKNNGLNGQSPKLGPLQNYGKTIDGFKNVRVSINGKSVIEMESIHNWQKIKDYIKARDIPSLDANRKHNDKIQVHHITQLQNGGTENVKNYVALSENTHKLVDSCKLLLDKNSSIYRELYNSKITSEKITDTGLKEKNNVTLNDNTEDLDLSSKILVNSLKIEVESHSALRLTVLVNKTDKIKMLFIDCKTGEEFRLVTQKIKMDNREDKNIVKTALSNFVGELPTSI